MVKVKVHLDEWKEKSYLAGNVNLGRSYHITTVTRMTKKRTIQTSLATMGSEHALENFLYFKPQQFHEIFHIFSFVIEVIVTSMI